jgi:glycosyltransferase 2 family protein
LVKHRTALVSLLAVGLLVWFLRHANLGDVWHQVQRARMELLLVALLVVVATYWARAVRWHYLLVPIGHTRFRTVFRATIIGFAALGLLPARAGDVLRPYLVARQEGLSLSSVFATIVIERVLDLIVVLSLLAVYLAVAADVSAMSPALLRSVVVSASVAGLLAALMIGVLWLVASHPERVGGLVMLAARVLPHALAQRLASMAQSFSGGLAVARRPRELVAAIAWSLGIWICHAAEVWIVTLAFGMALPAAGSFLLQALLVIGVAVPTPGGVGSFHEAYRFGMTTFFGAANDKAIAAALVLHAISFVPVILLGLLFMARDGLSLGGLKELARSAPQEGVATNQ